MIVILGKFYIITKKALQIFRDKAYDLGFNKGYELCNDDKKLGVVDKPWSLSAEALNPKMRRQIEEILRQKGGF